MHASALKNHGKSNAIRPRVDSIDGEKKKGRTFSVFSFRGIGIPVLTALILAALILVAAGCISPSSRSEGQGPGPALSREPSPADTLMSRGAEAFDRGAFGEAIAHWSEAAGLYEREGRSKECLEVLMRLSYAYGSMGLYRKALEYLEATMVLAKALGDKRATAEALGQSGNLRLGMGRTEAAERSLKEGLMLAKGLEDPWISAAILNNLGNLYTSTKRHDLALATYLESTELAEKNGNRLLAATGLINAARAAIKKGDCERAGSWLEKAKTFLDSLEDTHNKAYGLITIGRSYDSLRPYLGSHDRQILSSASETLMEAGVVAGRIGDSRAASYAWGYLGGLYEKEGQYQEALQLTRKASFEAQKIQAPESLYRWQWQSGRLLNRLGRKTEAMDAYRGAANTLQSIGEEMSSCYGNPESSFRSTARDICSEYVDLLLQYSATLKKPEEYPSYLVEARKALEMSKVFELRDYFRDDCVDAARFRITDLDKVSKNASVVYPILLQDRTELLISLPTGLKRYTVPIGSDVMTEEIRTFRRMLEKRTTREFLPHAQRLYDWLIRPLEKDLSSVKVNALVFVPDGALRTIPLSALHDGKQFLISKYPLAITPGITLTDPHPIQREKARVLAVGLTESVQGFPPLPDVSVELNTIRSLYEGKTLLNQDFRIPRLEAEMRKEEFTILHIASHGKIESDFEQTFILAFDGRFTMDQLDAFVGLLQFREEPLELLVLSACETAAGDDRAALGLAGIAIKAGARSALATLWHINDVASSILISEFYRQIKEVSTSRAAALQRAQLRLMSDPRYRHPGYWSPFLMINNWL